MKKRKHGRTTLALDKSYIKNILFRISEKQQLLTVPDLGENMAAVQGLLKKHDAFETDLSVHNGCCKEIVGAGQKLIDDGNHHADNIVQRCEQVK